MSIVYQSKELTEAGQLLALNDSPLRNVYIRGLIIVPIPNFVQTTALSSGSYFNLELISQEETVFDMPIRTFPSTAAGLWEGGMGTWTEDPVYTYSPIYYIKLPDPGMYFPSTVDVEIALVSSNPPKISAFYSTV